MKLAHLLPILLLPLAARAEVSSEALKVIKAVGPEGRGNEEASAAWKQLSTGKAESIPSLLAAMDGANDLALNWLRSAIDVIADRESQTGGKLPLPELGAFLLDTRHNPKARRLAFDLLGKADAAVADKLVPGMLQDPSVELRREAVGRLMDEAAKTTKAGQKETATVLYQQALQGARDPDQVDEIAKQMKELGRTVDLPRHFGFLMDWRVIGPFENTGRKGFGTVFPPEQAIDLAAEYDGKPEAGGVARKVKWTEFKSADPYGKVDFNKPLGALKEVTAYALAEFESETDRPAELRLGSKNGWKIWLNGDFLFGRDEYHRGAEIDQYRLPVSLKKGKNRILMKICQNEQTEDWTVEWEFQLRVCDATGTAILAMNR